MVASTVQFLYGLCIVESSHSNGYIWISTGSMWGRASSTCGWNELESSSWRNPRAQKQVKCEKFMLNELIPGTARTGFFYCTDSFTELYLLLVTVCSSMTHTQFMPITWSKSVIQIFQLFCQAKGILCKVNKWSPCMLSGQTVGCITSMSYC